MWDELPQALMRSNITAQTAQVSALLYVPEYFININQGFLLSPGNNAVAEKKDANNSHSHPTNHWNNECRNNKYIDVMFVRWGK